MSKKLIGVMYIDKDRKLKTMYYSENYINSITSYMDRKFPYLVKNNKVNFGGDFGEPDEATSIYLPLPERKVYILFEKKFECGTYVEIPNRLENYKGGRWILKDNILIYRIEASGMCCFCEKANEIKDTNKPDSLLQQAIYSHGLDLGCEDEIEKKDVKKVFKKLYDAVNAGNAEFSCSWKTQHLGNFGIFVSGKVTLASNTDMLSVINNFGYRVFNTNENRYTDNIFTKKEEMDFSIWPHTEFFVIPKRIHGIWIYESFYKDKKDDMDYFINAVRNWIGDIKVYILK